MLVWNEIEDAHDLFARLPDRFKGTEPLGGHCRLMSAVHRIIKRGIEPIHLEPNRLTMALLGAFKRVGGRVEHWVATACFQWQQILVWASTEAVRRSCLAKPLAVLTQSALTTRRTKAFFFAQKVNGRNAP